MLSEGHDRNSKCCEAMITTVTPALNQSASYSITQAAALLGIHRNTMARYIAAGRLKTGISRLDGRRRVITGKVLMRFWEASMKPI